MSDTYFAGNDLTGWDKFQLDFGYGGIHYYSKPVYNRDHTILVVQHMGFGHYTLGSSGWYVYRLKNKKWVEVTNQSLWIS